MLGRHVSIGLAGYRSFPPSLPVKAGHTRGLGFANAIYITDITNSRAKSHFKATRWVIGELLKFNTTFPLKYKAFD